MSSSSLFAPSLVFLAITLPGCVGSSWLLPQDPASLAELSGAREADALRGKEQLAASADERTTERGTASIDSILDEVEYLKEAEPAKYRLLKTALQEASQEELPPHMAARLQHQMRAVMGQQPTEIGLEPSPLHAGANPLAGSPHLMAQQSPLSQQPPLNQQNPLNQRAPLSQQSLLDQEGHSAAQHQLVAHHEPSGVRASAFEVAPGASPTPNRTGAASPTTGPQTASDSSTAATPSAAAGATTQPSPTADMPPQPEVADSQPSEPVAAKASEPPPTPSTQLEQELQAAEANWRDQLAGSIARLEAEVAKTEDPAVRAELETHLRVAYILANRREDALRAIGELSEHEAEYWKHLAHGLLVSLDPDQRHAESRKAALSLRHLRNAVDHLANTSTLDLRNLSFCRQVISFGDYEEFKPYTFQPGSEVALYVEVENFAVQPMEGKFETELQGEYSILDARGAHVFSTVLPRDKQICNNRRRDYFIAYRLYLPEEIAAGEYQLVLTMEDVKGKKSNQASVEFKIQ